MVDFLIDSYGVPEPWGIGDVVYPNEPHNIQQYQVSQGNTIFFGRFVIRNFADAYETVMLPPASTPYSALLGISLNTNPFHMLSDGVTKTKAYAESDTVPVAMLDMTLSVAMDMVLQDGIADILKAPLSVICAADNTAGKLYVGSTPPAGSIPLISDKFSLRRGPDITSDKQCYLYVKAGTQLQTDGAQTDTRRADFLKNPPEPSKTIAKENK